MVSFVGSGWKCCILFLITTLHASYGCRLTWRISVVHVTTVMVIYLWGSHSRYSVSLLLAVSLLAMWGHGSVGRLPCQIWLMHRYWIVSSLTFHGKFSYTLAEQFCYVSRWMCCLGCWAINIHECRLIQQPVCATSHVCCIDHGDDQVLGLFMTKIGWQLSGQAGLDPFQAIYSLLIMGAHLHSR